MVSRNDKNIPAAIIDTAFSLDMQKNNTVTTAVLSNGDSAVVQLTAIKSADDREADQKKIQALQKDMPLQMGGLEYQLYVKGARDRAKVKIISAD